MHELTTLKPTVSLRTVQPPSATTNTNTIIIVVIVIVVVCLRLVSGAGDAGGFFGSSADH